MKPPRLNAFRITAVIFALAVIFSLPALRGSGRTLDHGANLQRFLARFWPPDFSILPDILPALGETIQIAVLATLAAGLVSLVVAIAAARNIAPAPVVLMARFGLNVIRSIPSLIWALLAVAAFAPPSAPLAAPFAFESAFLPICPYASYLIQLATVRFVNQ
jgi:phosphonate transport system permease protein